MQEPPENEKMMHGSSYMTVTQKGSKEVAKEEAH